MFSNLKNIYAIVGANFGDEGKGMMTAYFVREASHPIVVLHNGGCQRGHTVLSKDNNIRHIFHHFGAGTLDGAPTFFADTFLINPMVLVREYNELKEKGITPHYYIHKDCLITTIYDVMINQILEIDRGRISKHGSCGWGIFETLYRNQSATVDFKDKLIKKCSMTVEEFNMLNIISKIDFMDFIRKEYLPLRLNSFNIRKDMNEYYSKIINSDGAMIHYIEDFNFMIQHADGIVDNEILNGYEDIIFENGQGLLLDQNNEEYFPHLTPSNTGIKNPVAIMKTINTNIPIHACYVSRTYVTRHGAGRLDNECDKKNICANMWDRTNIHNPWQDSLRYGFLDYKNLMKNINNDIKDGAGLVDFSIAFTHLNEYPIKRFFPENRYISFKDGEVIKRW